MAGKNIYIEKILDNLLGGIDTALAKMVAALEKMMGKTEESDGSSLTDVVNKLNDVVGEDGKSLSNVVSELQNNSAAIIGTGSKTLTDVNEKLNDVVDAIGQTAAGIFVKRGNTENITLNKYNFNISSGSASGTLFTCNCTGVLYVKFFGNLGSWAAAHVDVKINNMVVGTYTVPRGETHDYEGQVLIAVKVGDIVSFTAVHDGQTSNSFRGTSAAAVFDIGVEPSETGAIIPA